MPDRSRLLKQIQEISFTLDDLTLYLDTHPTDQDALGMFGEMQQHRKDLLQNYARDFEPLTRDCVCPDTNNQTNTHCKYSGQKHFTWSDGPLPWDNQGGA